MLLECPTRHRPHRRRHTIGARHARRPRSRRPLLCAAVQTTGLPVDGLRGSYDPVWTAGAEGRFLAGAFSSPSRHPFVAAGRVLLLIALVAPGLGPFVGALRFADGGLRAPITIGVVATALLLGSRFARRRYRACR